MRPFFSFEFFPPKDDEGSRRLFDTIAALAALAAGLRFDHLRRRRIDARAHGRARQADPAGDRSDGRRARHVRRRDRAPNCARSSTILARAGIENVLALRGDPPAAAPFEPPPGGFAHASELIAMLRRNYDFCIGAACYPEKHPEAASDRTTTSLHLKREGRRRRRLPRLATLFR